MAGISEQSFDVERTVVVLNCPSNVGEDELTIHFQKAKHGGGDVDDVVINEIVAFVTFDLPQVATSVLRHEHIINDCKLKVESYNCWVASKKKQDSLVVEDSEPEDAGNTTIYVSGLKESTTKDAVTLFFENKKRTGGGDLCEGKEGYKRISDTVARLTFVSSKVAQMVLKKASKTQLELEGNLLKVSDVFEPTHDRSILLAKNLNPKTSKETFRNFVETTKCVDVFNIVFGKDKKAIVILKSEIGEDDSEQEKSSCEDKEMKLEGSIISLEFCPLTKGIQISNIPPQTSQDDIKFRFSNPRIGGSEVTDIMFDKRNGVANVYFEKSSVVSGLVKQTHTLKNIPLVVIPYYDDFEEVQESTTKPEYSGEYHLDPTVMYYIMNKQEIEVKFDFKTMRFDENTSQLHFTKQLDDRKDATEFKNELKEYLHSFVKEEVRIPIGVFETVKKAIEGKRDEYEAEKVDLSFKDLRVILVGKRTDVAHKKLEVETMIDRFTQEAQKESTKFPIEDKNKLKFLNFIDYFQNLMTELPEVQIHGMDGKSGNLSLLGTAEKIRDVKLKILEDLVKISENEVKMSDRQIDFLRRTECKIVNTELKKDDVMLMLLPVKGHVGAKALQAKIFSLKKYDDKEETRLESIVFAKTSEKCKTVDEETANFVSKLNKLQEFKREQFDRNQVLIDQELTNPCNIWIVCEVAKMNKAENELARLTDDKKIESCIFKRVDPMKVRFLKEHCWSKIKEEEKSCKAEGVAVLEIDSDSLEIKGTQAGRREMITFLQKLAENIYFKKYQLSEPGMKKQINMDGTSGFISEIEKNHHCVVERDNNDSEKVVEKTEKDAEESRVEEATATADGAAGTSGTSTMNLPYNSMSFVNDKEVKMASGHKITIVVGDLAHQQVDVIVNTTNDKMDLNANPCGKALLKVAGKELANECQKIGSLSPGGMASTGPAKLSCKRVYHVRSSPWDNGKGAPILRQIVNKCLDQVENDKSTSIAIPAIGTGNLHFPRTDVAKIFFEEVTSYFTAHPQSAIIDVRFVAYGRDKDTVDAFLGAVQEIKSVILPTPIARKSVPSPIPKPRKTVTPNVSHYTSLGNAIINDKPDGSLELLLGSKTLAVEIVCDDISKETTDVIMHVTSQDFSFNGGVGKALIKAGGDSIMQECKTLGQPALFSTEYTKAGNLSANQIAHVIGPGQPSYQDLKKCLDNFFDDISKKNIAKISFSAIGAGAMGYSESQSADLIFDNLFKIAKLQNLTLTLARVVIFDKQKFIKFKDATKVYVATGGATSSSPQPSKVSPKLRFSVFGRPKKATTIKTAVEDEGKSIKIHSDNRGDIEKAWVDLKKKLIANIQTKTMSDDIIRKFSKDNVDKLRSLGQDDDLRIEVDTNKGMVKITGYFADVANVQFEVHKILEDIKNSKTDVPDYWDDSLAEDVFHRIKLSPGSDEYKKVEDAFKATVSFHIVSIERIQNKAIYQVFNVKRKAMEEKYGSNFPGKELMLFHGTSCDNVEKINAGGLNRSFAGKNATHFGRGVYFARNAKYSCQVTYSPPDPQGLRYVYYARVLVGEYTNGNAGFLVAPSKGTGNPNEKYDSVVNDVNDARIFVMFQDYEYYTEYLITFK